MVKALYDLFQPRSDSRQTVNVPVYLRFPE